MRELRLADGSTYRNLHASLREASTTSLVPVEINFVLWIIQAGPILVYECADFLISPREVLGSHGYLANTSLHTHALVLTLAI